jgi:hypothetical protein
MDVGQPVGDLVGMADGDDGSPVVVIRRLVEDD